MVLFLNILLSVISVGILAGRVYEILKIIDIGTGFLTGTGIIFNPYILVIYLIIIVCCGILIFQSDKKVEPFFSKSDGFFSIIAGATLVVAAVFNLNIGNLSYFAIIGGIAFIMLGVFGLKNKFTDKVIMLLMLVFVIGINLDVIIFNVSTIHNIEFLKNALSYLFVTIFIMMLFKNMYAPSKTSKMFLYTTGYLNFIFCTIMYIADIMGDFAQGRYEISQLIWDFAFVLIGFYAFATALSVSSAVKNTQKNEEYDDDEETEYSTEDEYFLNLNNASDDDIEEENQAEEILENDCFINSNNQNINTSNEVYKANNMKKFFKMQDFEENIEKEKPNKIKYSAKDDNKNKKVIYKKPK